TLPPDGELGGAETNGDLVAHPRSAGRASLQVLGRASPRRAAGADGLSGGAGWGGEAVQAGPRVRGDVAGRGRAETLARLPAHPLLVTRPPAGDVVAFDRRAVPEHLTPCELLQAVGLAQLVVGAEHFAGDVPELIVGQKLRGV